MMPSSMASSCFASFSPVPATKIYSLNPSPHHGFLQFPSFTSLPPTMSSSYGRKISSSHSLYSFSFLTSNATRKVSKILSVLEENVTVDVSMTDEESKDKGALPEEAELDARPFKLYVCNLPESTDVSELLEVFKPYGSVLSVEVSRNADTGKSRGCGYVTMGSRTEARGARNALDRSDLGGRELCVRFIPDTTPRKKVSPKKNLIYESPHKAYVGNLAWSVKPQNLNEHFSQYGTVVSARIQYDRKMGKNRVYAFLSFSSEAELESAKASDGVEFHGRKLVVRGIVSKAE